MIKRTSQRQVEILGRHPSVKTRFEELCATRHGEITDELLQSDDEYKALTMQRASTSQAVLEILSEHGMSDRFEAYSDAVYAEEVYEIDVIYSEAFLDAIETMERFVLS